MLPIRVRLTLIYSALLFLALALSGGAVVTLLRSRLNIRLDETLDRRLQGVENFLIRETTAATANKIPLELAEYASTQPEGHLIEVKDRKGNVILASDRAPYPLRSRTRTFAIYGEPYWTKASASMESVEESVQEIRFLLLWSSPLLLALIGLSGYWLSSRSLRPVDEMTRAARTIGAGDLSARLVVPGGRDEITRLAEAWNEMLGRLEESFARMQRFTADAAHELRTPLAALKTTAELSLRRSRQNEEYREALKQVVQISDRIQALAETLLAIARGQVPNIGVGEALVDLGSLVDDLAVEMRPLMDDKRLSFQVQTKSLIAEVNSDGVRRIVAILLDNAMKYTPAGGIVSVAVAEAGDRFEVAVTDTGTGIPEAELSRIFERFYRVDASRDRKTGGFGLGLAIARQIAQGYGGDIHAVSTLGAGSTFVLNLPRRPPR